MEGVPETRSARRRRRRSSKQSGGTWSDYFRGRSFARLVFFGMCALGLVYAAKFVWDARMATIGIYGVTPNDVRYAFGPPQAIEEGGKLYRYDNGKRVVLVRFGDDGFQQTYTCSAQGPGECDEILDIGIGEPEEQVLLQLGPPSRTGYTGDDKLLHYDGLGLSVQMRQFKVHALHAHKGATFIGYFSRALWRMVP